MKSNDTEIVDMFAAGLSMRKIAEKFGVTHRNISNILKEKGYTSDFRKVLPEKEVIDYYLNDEDVTIAATADKYNVSSSVISRILKKHDISVKRHHASNIDVDVDFIIDKYTKNKMSMSGIAEILDVHIDVVRNRLQKANIILRTPSEVQQKYSVNENFFYKIELEKQAYWLGFMFADGYVHSNLRDFGITLSEKDQNHVQKFADDIEFTGSVKVYPATQGSYSTSNYARIVPASKKVCTDLISHGCIPRKTHFTDKPIGVPKELNRHFIRGVVDGDGGIYIYENNFSIEIVGDLGLLEWIKQVSPVELSALQKHKTIWRIRTKSSTALQFANWLYEDSTVSLNRKYDKFLIARERFSDV